MSYHYGDENSVTDRLGAVIQILENDKPIVSYKYSGSGSPVQTAYNEPSVALSYVNGGLDSFGRIVNHGWLKDEKPLVQIIHSYDYAGNRLSRHDAVMPENSETYRYDNLNQIVSLKRENFAESWQYDATGNWLEYNRNGNSERRTHNAANEIQGIATHDKNGNMVVIPAPDVERSETSGLKAKYDAWNRLVEVRNNNDELVTRYDYNGLNQRIAKTVGQTVTRSFFNENWQELESVTNDVRTTYVWGLRYVDDLVLRERNNERLYSLADANWNVVCVTDANGDAKERL